MSATGKKRGIRTALKDRSVRELVFMSAIPLAMIFIFNYIPITGFLAAFKDYKTGRGIWASDWAGMENILILLKNPGFRHALVNTFLYNIAFFIAAALFAIIVSALLFNLKSGVIKKFYQTALIVPYFISWVFAGELLHMLFNHENGALNQILALFGKAPVLWYNMPDIWPWIMVLAFLWKYTGLGSVIYFASLTQMEDEIFDAAKADGAGMVKTFIYIMLPSFVPVTAVLFVMFMGRVLVCDSDMFSQLTREMGNLLENTDVLDLYILRNLKNSDMSLSAAAGFIQSLAGCLAGAAAVLILRNAGKEKFLF